jgi:hypothetical protein
MSAAPPAQTASAMPHAALASRKTIAAILADLAHVSASSCLTTGPYSHLSPLPPLLRVSRTNLRHYSRAQGFSNSGCSAGGVTTSNPNARTVCLTYSGNRQSGRWLTGLASRVKREPEVEACAEPNVVLKVRDGVTRRIELSDGMTVEEALETEGGEIVDAMGIQGEYEFAE